MIVLQSYYMDRFVVSYTVHEDKSFSFSGVCISSNVEISLGKNNFLRPSTTLNAPWFRVFLLRVVEFKPLILCLH